MHSRTDIHFTSLNRLVHYPMRTATCVSVCVKLCGVVSRKGGISAKYRRTQILIESTCIHIDGLTAPTPAWLQRHTHIYIHIGTCAISWATSWTMRWTMHSLSSECPIWRFMRRPTRALNILLSRRVFRYVVHISWFATSIFFFSLVCNRLSDVSWLLSLMLLKFVKSI